MNPLSFSLSAITFNLSIGANVSHVQWYKLAWVDDSIRFIPSRRLIIWWCDDFMSHIRSHMQVEHRMCVCVCARKKMFDCVYSCCYGCERFCCCCCCCCYHCVNSSNRPAINAMLTTTNNNDKHIYKQTKREKKDSRS